MERLKRYILFKLTKGLLPVFDVKDVVTFDKYGRMFVGGEKATNDQIIKLQTEVKILEQMELWKYINSYLNKVVSKMVFEKSQTMTDLVAGKSILYALDVQSGIIKRILQAKLE
jgi:hypothetical protein